MFLRVVTYHGVVDRSLPTAKMDEFFFRNSVTASTFRTHVEALQDRFGVLTHRDLKTLERGGVPDRPGAVLLTFDDGLKNNATVAVPVLQQLGAAAVFFLPTGLIAAEDGGGARPIWTEDVAWSLLQSEDARRLAVQELFRGEASAGSMDELELVSRIIGRLKRYPDVRRREMVNALSVYPKAESFPSDGAGGTIVEPMTWADVASLLAHGNEVGGHSRSHPILSSVNDDQSRNEIAGCRRDLLEKTTSEAVFFAYPNGRPRDFDTRDVRIVRETGFQWGFTQVRGPNWIRRPKLQLRRLNVSNRWSEASLCRRLELPWMLANGARDGFAQARRRMPIRQWLQKRS